MISVVLADDHVVVRTGIKMLLDADPDIEVVAEAAEGTEAYSLVARYKPDVLLLDISMPPGQSGLIACEKTARDFPDTKVVILTMFAEPEYLLYTLRGGAAGYVLKNSTPEQLRQAVHDVANGGSYDRAVGKTRGGRLKRSVNPTTVQPRTGDLAADSTRAHQQGDQHDDVPVRENR